MKYFLMIALGVCSGHLYSQVKDDSVNVDTHHRTFHFIQPATSAGGASIIFILHGSGGDGAGMMKNTAKLQQALKNENVFIVYPDAYLKYWNECRKASPAVANKENINDVGFFGAMINYFVEKFSANRQNVFVVGTSGGGHMVYKLAMESPENFSAFTSIIANVPDTDNLDCAPKNVAVSMMIINGTKDAINPYNGGPVIFSDKTNMGNVVSTDRSFSYWAKLAGYNGKPVHQKLPDTDPSDGKTIEKYTYSEKEKPEVVLLKVNNGEHGYPNDIDVHITAWEFFKRHMKP